MRLDPVRGFLARRIEAVIAGTAFVAVMAVSLTLPAWQALERRVFDFLTVSTAPGELSQPIVLVAINEESMNAMGRQWPWPRSWHADLIERMARGGAAVIALDIVFAEPANDPAEDEALARAIAKAGNVVLAADFTYRESSGLRLWTRTDPMPRFIDGGALAGLATVRFDPDQFVRAVPEEHDAFWRQILKVLQVRSPALGVPPLPESGALIRYLGPDSVFDPIPYHLVMEATPEELKQVFQGRVVIVGRDLRATPEIGMAHPDLFATPFLPYSGTLTAGIKLHATIVDNALAGSWLRRLHPAGGVALGLLAAALSFGLMRRWNPIVAAAAVAAAAAAFAALAWYAFAHQRLWVPFAAPVAVVLVCYLTYLGRAYMSESRRKRELQKAFSLYVSPRVVEELVEDPKKLRLGGERREITAFFTDLAGFTTLSESTAPEVVQQVLARHFTMLTEVIFSKNGTVVQFMGDGLMAIFNAPLPDPDHAANAVRAAVLAQEGMEKLRAELRAEGLPEIRMRVGINTCEAVVGNMGSETRLSYSAMGDGVNLASRLEGANKLYATPILVSGETAARLDGRIAMRRVDRIRVAGKSQPVDVFTPVADAALAERTAAAFDAYARGELDMAATLYSELHDADPADRVAARLLERIEKMRRDRSLVTADGSVSLEKM